jgi:transaldolase
MKLFLDSADTDELERACSLGIIEGVTTNPTLLKQALDVRRKGKKRVDLEEYLRELVFIAKGMPISLEVASTEYEKMHEEALSLYQRFNPLANNVVIKIPFNPSLNGKTRTTDGIKAIRALAQARIQVNATLLFTPEQALIAAKAGATYASLFIGRIDDNLRTQHGIGFEKEDYFPGGGYVKEGKHIQDNGIVSGIDALTKTAVLFKQHGLKTQLLAASIRNVQQMREAALAGANIATIPLSVLMNALNHPESQKGIKKFLDDVPSEYAKLAIKKK